ncbi:Sorting nexin-17 [Platysternon megacephalum]|uniref:Sorting nexin-17 n=1 Tax=Platysternon megacephalum TaxID=55544 RepID=A0A4D9DTF7_9SAUR|nr:Sorting nexin-17 [Platysternon megacephalum]
MRLPLLLLVGFLEFHYTAHRFLPVITTKPSVQPALGDHRPPAQSTARPASTTPEHNELAHVRQRFTKPMAPQPRMQKPRMQKPRTQKPRTQKPRPRPPSAAREETQAPAQVSPQAVLPGKWKSLSLLEGTSPREAAQPEGTTRSPPPSGEPELPTAGPAAQAVTDAAMRVNSPKDGLHPERHGAPGAQRPVPKSRRPRPKPLETRTGLGAVRGQGDCREPGYESPQLQELIQVVRELRGDLRALVQTQRQERRQLGAIAGSLAELVGAVRQLPLCLSVPTGAQDSLIQHSLQLSPPDPQLRNGSQLVYGDRGR